MHRPGPCGARPSQRGDRGPFHVRTSDGAPPQLRPQIRSRNRRLGWRTGDQPKDWVRRDDDSRREPNSPVGSHCSRPPDTIALSSRVAASADAAGHGCPGEQVPSLSRAAVACSLIRAPSRHRRVSPSFTYATSQLSEARLGGAATTGAARVGPNARRGMRMVATNAATATRPTTPGNAIIESGLRSRLAPGRLATILLNQSLPHVEARVRKRSHA